MSNFNKDFFKRVEKDIDPFAAKILLWAYYLAALAVAMTAILGLITLIIYAFPLNYQLWAIFVSYIVLMLIAAFIIYKVTSQYIRGDMEEMQMDLKIFERELKKVDKEFEKYLKKSGIEIQQHNNPNKE